MPFGLIASFFRNEPSARPQATYLGNQEPTAMIANASHFTTPPHIEYTLTPSQQGWRLTIWEEAAVTEKRVRPFLWKFGVEIATLSEVNFILQSILGNYNSDSDGDEGSECRDTLKFQKN